MVCRVVDKACTVLVTNGSGRPKLRDPTDPDPQPWKLSSERKNIRLTVHQLAVVVCQMVDKAAALWLRILAQLHPILGTACAAGLVPADPALKQGGNIQFMEKV